MKPDAVLPHAVSFFNVIPLQRTVYIPGEPQPEYIVKVVFPEAFWTYPPVALLLSDSTAAAVTDVLKAASKVGRAVNFIVHLDPSQIQAQHFI